MIRYNLTIVGGWNVIISPSPTAGSSECFLFSLHPNMAVYTVTGYNDHYMYLQQTAQTMPNGLVGLHLSFLIQMHKTVLSL